MNTGKTDYIKTDKQPVRRRMQGRKAGKRGNLSGQCYMSQTESFDLLSCQDRNLGDQKQKITAVDY